MAVKTKCTGVDVRELKVGKPVISTDIMGNRNIEVRAVGAWVQPEAELTGYELQHGVVSARQEENRLRQSQIEKEERLKNFQREVKRRVKALDKVKKLKMIEKSVKEIEAERKIVQQSAFAKGQKKDNCFVHKQSNIAIRSPRSKKIKGRPEYESSDASQGLPLQAFSNKKQQTHTVVSQARRNLVSRQVMMESPSDEDDNAECHIDNYRLTERLTGHPCQSEEDKMLGLCNGLSDINLKQHSRPRNVHFDLPSESVSEKDNQSFRHTVRPSRSNTGVHVAGVPEIYSGVLTEDEKRRKQMQHALYRRLFMDIEREQVKENQRRKDHRKRIARLKEQKEANRRQEEDTAWTLVEPRDPVTGETQGETILRERAEQVTALNALEQQQAQRQKAREMQRYLDALKYRLRDRIESRDLQLPPLCCCGETIWDTNPDTCANNCVFYRNPKGYAKALQSLLSSFDV